MPMFEEQASEIQYEASDIVHKSYRLCYNNTKYTFMRWFYAKCMVMGYSIRKSAEIVEVCV